MDTLKEYTIIKGQKNPNKIKNYSIYENYSIDVEPFSVVWLNSTNAVPPENIKLKEQNLIRVSSIAIASTPSQEQLNSQYIPDLCGVDAWVCVSCIPDPNKQNVNLVWLCLN